MEQYDSDYADDQYNEDGYNDFEFADDIVACNEDDDIVDGQVSDSEFDHSIYNSKKTFTVLGEIEIWKRQEDEISHVSDFLSISIVAASKLLHHYKWNSSQLYDDWFADEEKVREKVGLPSKIIPFSVTKDKTFCGICFEFLPIKEFYTMNCGHSYCKECWKGYLRTAINDGPGCLTLRCPEPKCGVAVCRDMVDELVTEEEKRKYYRYFLRSYVEQSKKMKWCPAPGCENAVELESGSSVFDVTCLCSGTFCWNCGEDAHRPVDCETVAKWILKNKSESENTVWILANSKACPKCHRYIEKNHGCMHMTCNAPCRFEFCWLCLGDWREHGEKTGGFYACNKYEAAKRDGVLDEEERIREMAKEAIDKYTHYYERWASNHKSMEKAMEDLHKVKTDTLKQLSNQLEKPETDFKFITDAWEQIIRCRRVLKWTYAYGYYIPEDEIAKKQLFEYSQGEAEAALERLHNSSEKKLSVFLGDESINGQNPNQKDEKKPTEADFEAYRMNLVDLTVVTHSLFSTLVSSLVTQKF